MPKEKERVSILFLKKSAKFICAMPYAVEILNHFTLVFDEIGYFLSLQKKKLSFSNLFICAWCMTDINKKIICRFLSGKKEKV